MDTLAHSGAPPPPQTPPPDTGVPWWAMVIALAGLVIAGLIAAAILYAPALEDYGKKQLAAWAHKDPVYRAAMRRIRASALVADVLGAPVRDITDVYSLHLQNHDGVKTAQVGFTVAGPHADAHVYADGEKTADGVHFHSLTLTLTPPHTHRCPPADDHAVVDTATGCQINLASETAP